jgi:outer membrane receptor for ferrienterochelin and colicin
LIFYIGDQRSSLGELSCLDAPGSQVRRCSMRTCRLLIVLAAVLSVTVTPLLGQSASGRLYGKVTHDGEPLGGVRVVISSPALQGEKGTFTGAGGDYVFQFLPPGTYTILFSLEGYTTIRTEVKVPAAQVKKYDAELSERIEEEITVTGRSETVSTSQEVATTYSREFVEKLPIGRDLDSSVSLAPGVTNTGPNDNAVISGAPSFQNLYLLNGVVVNENLRGQPEDLFIEDAIQETTVQTGNVSAEYGRFSGGVVTAITKSGGNEFSGSARVSLRNEDWSARAPGEVEQEDEINEVYEGTFGGRILTDRLWFFLAGRDEEVTNRAQTTLTDLPYRAGFEETRLEAKLTGAITPNHRVIGSYFDITDDQFGIASFDPLALDHVDPSRTLPREGWSLNYNGIVSPSFFVEALYSERSLEFVDSGGDDRSFTGGTVILDIPNLAAFNAPLFCAVCGSEERSNDNLRLKGNWFLSTKTAGSHDIVFGADTFSDVRIGDNHGSASDYILFTTAPTVIDEESGELYPVIGNAFAGGPVTLVSYRPIRSTSKGTDFETNSLFVNDRWRLGAKWSFNVGVRYDSNDGENADGRTVVDDSRFSPRLSASYDLQGDGEWLFTLGYGQYVSAIANGIADQSAEGGTPAIQNYIYAGPNLNLDPADPDANTDEALAIVENWWFNEYGGPDNFALLSFARIPGVSDVIGDDLGSPYVDEWTFGVTKRLGSRGLIRADLIYRAFKDMYATRVDLSTGQVTDQFGQVFDLAIVENNDSVFERTYNGLHLAFQYQLSERWNTGANWTWSHTYGNFDGEGLQVGPFSDQNLKYPEYREPEWNFPRGDLATDIRHKINAWVSYDIFATERHALSATLFQSFFSGAPYSAVGSVISADFVPNPGYAIPPTDGVTYYFSPRGAFSTDDIATTDLAFNYSLFFRDIEIFIQPEIRNLWNSDGVIDVNTTVFDATNDASLSTFDPFTETPVEGVHYRLGDEFGEPQNPNDYQDPRTFTVSVGARF